MSSQDDLGTSSEAEPGSARWWADRAATEHRRRPRSGGLSTARIIDAALELLREGGVEALTVRAVADRLGTRSASLYRHIAGREELIALIADHVMGDIRIERTDRGWRADVEALMHEMRRVMLSQPLPASAARNTAGYGPNTLRLIDAALELFLAAGLDPAQAAYTTTAMIQLVAGGADIQRSAVGRGARGATRSAGFAELVHDLPADRFTAIRTAGADYVAAPADEVFTHGVQIFLDGVAARLDRQDRRSRPARTDRRASPERSAVTTDEP
ncbi:TetR/AcrR family transcriptional regulator [Nocardia sp. alder85J]|uniref:TetR/AcrR family transcriptional regulator n=1 Tax=Nocardia sp. alder85J TaxID=2862949 RepID=UPI001CD24D64|nr:TetR/AcrR family transcriptional regulator [Nocardia sp. alder85J]MCX4091939.1 TetR/AcrR family transcriptional regulator [Nocardia sp. alder85J]